MRGTPPRSRRCRRCRRACCVAVGFAEELRHRLGLANLVALSLHLRGEDYLPRQVLPRRREAEVLVSTSIAWGGAAPTVANAKDSIASVLISLPTMSWRHDSSSLVLILGVIVSADDDAMPRGERSGVAKGEDCDALNAPALEPMR